MDRGVARCGSGTVHTPLASPILLPTHRWLFDGWQLRLHRLMQPQPSGAGRCPILRWVGPCCFGPAGAPLVRGRDWTLRCLGFAPPNVLCSGALT
ncbi:hypothetical protein NDU88_001821 [Pleurodeles waltl]|uniref:Uncharacterized protein n=1 Tax=Pleurodeles waltl TaxID=8319 RepID=A0AAV7TL81_PLEWA|nr:hypothetical protein NDU88_001821 [Pleurodeles waltl]